MDQDETIPEIVASIVAHRAFRLYVETSGSGDIIECFGETADAGAWSETLDLLGGAAFAFGRAHDDRPRELVLVLTDRAVIAGLLAHGGCLAVVTDNVSTLGWFLHHVRRLTTVKDLHST
jgi:hypothetical protein